MTVSILSNNNRADADGNAAAEPQANEPVFWWVFKDLANENNGLVDHYKLHGRLLSTGKFYAGEAVNPKTKEDTNKRNIDTDVFEI